MPSIPSVSTPSGSPLLLTQPISQMTFTGQHLIEASAGTGKTFTLSDVMVRILTERYMPRQVIATTFTRAAAAELRSRIRQRLQHVQQQVRQWQQAISQSDITSMSAPEQDELTQVLIATFGPAVRDDGFGYLYNRLQVVLDSLDELFVGTLDSFIQKILREFAFDSGELVPRGITEDEQQYPYQIAHDVLRGWIQQQPQDVITALVLQNGLQSVDDYLGLIRSSLNFSDSVLQPVQQPVLQMDELVAALTHLQAAATPEALAALAPFFDENAQSHDRLFNKRSFNLEKRQTLFGEQLPHVLALIDGIRQLPVTYWQQKQLLGWLEKWEEYLRKAGAPKPFFVKAADPDLRQQFEQHPVLQAIYAVLDAKAQIDVDLQQLQAYVRFYLISEVRKRLPETLQRAGETTFSQQSQTLAQALSDQASGAGSGANGRAMAQAIMQRYPLILVDEFQDTNAVQDRILSSVWRQPQWASISCFIAVGDPKQAIYGFRGGDVLTYNNARQQMQAMGGRFYSLQSNFRSIPDLVERVDQLFDYQRDFGEQIFYSKASVDREKSRKAHHVLQESINGEWLDNIQPLRLLASDKPTAKYEPAVIAQTIRDLLEQSDRGELRLVDRAKPDSPPRPIQPRDLAILAFGNRELEQTRQALTALHIPVNFTRQQSVFLGMAAQHVGALLQALVQPDHEGMLKRALITPLIGYDVQDLTAEQMEHRLSEEMAQFRQLRDTWQKSGFLVAWQGLSEHYRIWQQLAERSGRDTERLIIDTRHLIELLSQHSQRMSMQHVLHWYQLQLGAPAQREWEMQRPLASADGVQLMTIHKSKGLEFGIVFLMKANAGRNTDSEIIYYIDHEQQQPRRALGLASNFQDPHLEAHMAQHEARQQAEQHRLWYVAMTRASYRIYAYFSVVDDQQAREVLAEEQRHGLDYWRAVSPESVQAFSLQLLPTISADEQLDSRPYRRPDRPTVPLLARPYPRNVKFYPQKATSFTGLTAKNTAQDTLAGDQQEQLADDEQTLVNPLSDRNTKTVELQPDGSETVQRPLPLICQHFPGGKAGGQCLHELLELIDFTRLSKNPADANKLIWQKLKEHRIQPVLQPAQLQTGPDAMNTRDPRSGQRVSALLDEQADALSVADQTLVQQVAHWMTAIAHFPLRAVGQQHAETHAETTSGQQDATVTAIALKNIPPNARLPELAFQMSLQDRLFESTKITALFKRFGIILPALNDMKSARSLSGAIDLVFYHGGRYHIADYKSNTLRPVAYSPGRTSGQQLTDDTPNELTVQHYDQQAMQRNMQTSGYYLQAALYLVALHRFLRQRIQAYDIRQHLGQAYYLYLRGMYQHEQYPDQTVDPTCGVFCWQAPVELILALDDLLGQHQPDDDLSGSDELDSLTYSDYSVPPTQAAYQAGDQP